MTPAAGEALGAAEVIVGYQTYLDLIPEFLAGKEVLASQMMKEVDRCRKALELAGEGRVVALVSGGDPGIYAMAGLVFEMAREQGCSVAIEVIAGIAALNACAARLGAPLMHDFAAISLSDLLTPWEKIEQRLEAGTDRGRLKMLIEKEGPPSPPSHLNQSVPKKLDELIMELLQKQPDQRGFSTAEDVLHFMYEQWPEESREMPKTPTSTMFGD